MATLNLAVGGGEVTSSSPVAPIRQSIPLFRRDTSRKAHTILMYGQSKTLKSWNALRIAEYILETTGKSTRVVYADVGGLS